jgi:hypothetical protein
MTSGRRPVRVPSPSDLHAEPPLGPLLLLDLAAAVAANALRAHHVAVEGEFFPGETDETYAMRRPHIEADVAGSKYANVPEPVVSN